MAKIDLQKRADDFFKRYARVDKVFITTDGQPFTEEHNAKNHAKAKDLDYKTFRRNDKAPEKYGFNDMDRAGLETFVKDKGLAVEFDGNTPDEELRILVKRAVEAAKPAKKSTPKKAKK
jgi:hypothetical protein